MHFISSLFTLITALIHCYFLYLEMFLWTSPFGQKVFKMSSEKAQSSKVLAANQGFYNGILALGLLATFFMSDPVSAMAIRRFCLCFIIAAGCYGWHSLKSIKVFAIQSLPAIIALAASYISN